jgi:hypothetical protein
MSDFTLYLILGFQHIADLTAFDHIVFIISLCAVYEIKRWKNILILVTAFTLGHSATLAIATLGLLKIPTELIEFLIPVTILITCVLNVIKSDKLATRKIHFNYGMALFFGLIHGLGFSNYLRTLLGREVSLWKPLLAFNTGLEIGQLLIVGISLTVATLFIKTLKGRQHDWNLFISGIGAGMAVMLMIQTKFW